MKTKRSTDTLVVLLVLAGILALPWVFMAFAYYCEWVWDTFGASESFF